jgi:glycosyltransferase involved in cell wall biosynthesis
MNNPIFFSIIVPTFNRAYLVGDTIESILSQSYKNFEVIIVDDGSTDNTEEIIQKYLSGNVHYYKKENAERAAARNFGARLAKGDYINWFDSDDLMMPNHLEEAAQTILKYGRPEIFAVGHRYQYPSGKQIKTVSYSSPTLNDIIYKGNPIINSPVIVRKDIALANPYNEDPELSCSEDFELWLRLASKFPLYSSPCVTVVIINHDERSTLTMTDPDKLISRFTKFIYYSESNPEVIALLGERKSVFEMKNYLLLAVDLTVNGHIRQGSKYLSVAFERSRKVIFERGFFAFIKYYLINILS